MTMASVFGPRALGISRMASTTPVTGAWIGTERKPSAWAIGSPRTTS